MDWKKINLMRIWRLILGVAITLQAFTTHAYWLLLLSVLLFYQVYTNVGCGISAGSGSPVSAEELDKTDFEEIK